MALCTVVRLNTFSDVRGQNDITVKLCEGEEAFQPGKRTDGRFRGKRT